MSKQIHVKVTHGQVNPATAPNRGSFELKTGSAAASQLSSELSGRFGETFTDRPVIVIPFDSADNAEQFKTFVDNFVPSLIRDTEKDEEFKMIRDQFIKPSAKRIGNDIILTRQDPIEEMIATIGPFTAITA